MRRLTGDRRKHQRMALRLVVQLGEAGNPAAAGCVTQNISSGGFYFLSPAPLIRGERVHAFLVLPGFRESYAEENAGISCDVRIVRVDALEDGSAFGIACEIERYTIARSPSLAWRNYA